MYNLLKPTKNANSNFIKIPQNKPIKQYMKSIRNPLKKSKRALQMGTPEIKKTLDRCNILIIKVKNDEIGPMTF